MKFSENSHRLERNKIFPYLVAVAKLLPGGGRKMAAIDGFQPLSGMLIIQSTWYVLYKLPKWVFRNNFNWDKVFKISALWRPENGSNTDGFWPFSRILITQSTSYLVYALIMQVFRDDKIFGQVDHFSPLVAKKWQQSRWLSIIIWYTDHWIHFILVIVVFRNDSIF